MNITGTTTKNYKKLLIFGTVDETLDGKLFM